MFVELLNYNSEREIVCNLLSGGLRTFKDLGRDKGGIQCPQRDGEKL